MAKKSAAQAAYDKALAEATAQSKRVENQRAAEKKRKEKTDKIARNLKTIGLITETVLNPAKQDLKNAENSLEPLYTAYATYYNAHKDDPGFNKDTNATLISIKNDMSIFLNKKKIAENKIKAANKEINELTAENVKLGNQSNTATAGVPSKPSSSSASDKGSAARGEKIKFSKDYKYNAPMVSQAYFGTPSLENTVLEGNLVDQGMYGDARRAWKGTTGGRGTFQMDKRFLSAFTSSSQESTKVKIDKQKYGFKFLYNPQTVQMSWGVMQYMSPPFEASGQDAFQVIPVGLMQSVVSFEILLNRIKDFDYINEFGLSSGNISPFVNTSSLPGINSVSKNPYPEVVPAEDLQEIWKKGTMYDIEYFLKTVNGPDGTFKSMLSGENTADRGWLRPTIVELHLGDGLRYRVRVSEFSVNHIIFNPRMVPMLSSMRLTCNRFADGPETEYYGPSQTTSAYGKDNLPAYRPGGSPTQ